MNKLTLTLISFISLYGFSISKLIAAENQKIDEKIITIETATIRGNQELPTVLYLVPWQPPKINPLESTQTADMTKHKIERIDRNSFKRLIEYHQAR